MELTTALKDMNIRLSRRMSINEKEKERKQKLYAELLDLQQQLGGIVDKYNLLIEATNLMNNVADSRVNKALDFILKACNDSLKKMFPEDFKEIKKHISSHMETYPQLNLVLETAEGKERNFKTQEGNGLAQVVSLMSTISLLYISGGRRLMILDEVLNGLHPQALELIENMLTVFEDMLGFNFIIINHMYRPNRGTVYHLKKNNFTTYVDSVEVLGMEVDPEHAE